MSARAAMRRGGRKREHRHPPQPLRLYVSICMALTAAYGSVAAAEGAAPAAALDGAAGPALTPLDGAAAASGGGASGGALAGPGPGGASPDGGATDPSITFNSGFLMGEAQHQVDLAQFAHASAVPPGLYDLDVYVNQQWIARRSLRFAVPPGGHATLACLDASLVQSWGLKPNLEKGLIAYLQSHNGCVNLAGLIPDAAVRADLGQLRLDVSLPQADMNLAARDAVSPADWDAGIPAGLLSYNFNAYRSSNGAQSQTSLYLGLNTGINLGDWHFRQNATATWQSATPGTPSHQRWQAISTYVQRDLPAWHAQLTLGDSYTDGQVQNSVSLRGVQLASDDRMLPQSQQGYAPVIRGVAQTNARVVVTQNGAQIYETTVAPGPFVINDLYPTGYSGDLVVSVIEATGQVNTFTVPYAAVQQLLRPGQTRWNLAAGQLRNIGGQTTGSTPNAVVASAQRGLNNWVTAYTGMAFSEGYGSAVIGGAFNTPIGAVAVDASQSYTRIPGASSQSGQSYRLTYSKFIPETKTNVSVAAYRYSTGGYLSLNDAATVRDYAKQHIDPFTVLAPTNPVIDGVPFVSPLTLQQQANLGGHTNQAIVQQYLIQRRRSQFDLTLNQTLGQRYGSIYATVSATSYWGQQSSNISYQVGYNNHWKRVNYSLSASRVQLLDGHYDNEYFAGVQFPLGHAPQAPQVSVNVSHLPSTGNTEQANLTGTFGPSDVFSYGIQGSHQPQAGSSGSANVGYRSPYAMLGASYGSGPGYSQASATASGGVVVFGGGVVFGQSLGDTVGIVQAPGAEGAAINNAVGSQVGASGYGLVPYLTPYQMNRVQLSPEGASLDVQLDGTSRSVAPHAGAVVLMKFKTTQGHVLVLHATLPGGEPMPFGADVVTASGEAVGIVGQGGRVLVRVPNAQVALSARWTDEHDKPQTCRLQFQWPVVHKGDRHSSDALYQEASAKCVGPIGNRGDKEQERLGSTSVGQLTTEATFDANQAAEPNHSRSSPSIGGGQADIDQNHSAIRNRADSRMSGFHDELASKPKAHPTHHQFKPGHAAKGVTHKRIHSSAVLHANAVVEVSFKTHGQVGLVLHVVLPNGNTLPLGADILNEHGKIVGIVDQHGRALVRVSSKSTPLIAHWLDEHDHPQSRRLSLQWPVMHKDDHRRSKVPHQEVFAEGSTNVGPRTTYATFEASHAAEANDSRSSLSVSGGHAGIDQSLNVIGSVAGSRVSGNNRLHIQYSINRQREPEDVTAGVMRKGASSTAALHASAVVALSFKTQRGLVLVLHATLPNGDVLPLGADILNKRGDTVGIVGQSGRVLVRVSGKSMPLIAHWLDEHNHPQSRRLSLQWPVMHKDDHRRSKVPHQEVFADYSHQGSTNVGPRTTYATFEASHAAEANDSRSSLSVGGGHAGIDQNLNVIGSVAGSRVGGNNRLHTQYPINRQREPEDVTAGVMRKGASSTAALHASAVVALSFKTQRGLVLVLHATLPNGDVLPLGADILNKRGDTVGIVGKGGRVLVRVPNEQVALAARWMDEHDKPHTCRLQFPWHTWGKQAKNPLFDERHAREVSPQATYVI